MSLVDFEEKFRVSLGRSAQNELNVLEESAPAASGGTRYTTTYFVLYAGLEKRTFASPTMTIEKEKQVELEQSSRVDKPNALALPKSLQVSVQVCRFVVVLGLDYILDTASLFTRQHSLQPLRNVGQLSTLSRRVHTYVVDLRDSLLPNLTPRATFIPCIELLRASQEGPCSCVVAKSANRLILIEPPEVLQLEEVGSFRPVAEDAFLALVEVASGVVSVPVPSGRLIRGRNLGKECATHTA